MNRTSMLSIFSNWDNAELQINSMNPLIMVILPPLNDTMENPLHMCIIFCAYFKPGMDK